MIDEKQIQEWLDSGLINKQQAQKMLGDVQQKSKEDRSNKFIVGISTIGAVLLGIGAILFVASMWEVLSNLMKVIILLVSTFGAYYLGYLFKYDKQNLPKVGVSLFLLGALLFGASVFLIAQIYNINANSHWLVLIRLVGVLPLVYAFRSQPITVLSAILFLIWIGLFIFRGDDFSQKIFFFLPVIYLSVGMLLFNIGGLHYLDEKLVKIGKIFRISGIKIALFSLFLLTFNSFSGDIEGLFANSRMVENLPPQILVGVLLFFLISIIGSVVTMIYNPLHSKTNLSENGVALGLLGFTLIFFFFPAESSVYTVIYNILFAGLTIYLLYIGYQRSNIGIVNLGIFWVSFFIFAKYFDFFWELMDRSIFFIVGGLLLVLGGIAMEKKRRQIKENFTQLTS